MSSCEHLSRRLNFIPEVLWNLNRLFMESVSHLALKLLSLMSERWACFHKTGWVDYFHLPKRLIFRSLVADFFCKWQRIFAHAHAQGVSPSFHLQPKTADACKNGRFGRKNKLFFIYFKNNLSLSLAKLE